MHSEILDRSMPVDVQLTVDYWNSANASKTFQTDWHQWIAFSTVLHQSFKNILIETWLDRWAKHADARMHAAEQSIRKRRQKLPSLLCRYIEDYERFKESRSNPNKVLIVHPMKTVGDHHRWLAPHSMDQSQQMSWGEVQNDRWCRWTFAGHLFSEDVGEVILNRGGQ